MVPQSGVIVSGYLRRLTSIIRAHQANGHTSGATISEIAVGKTLKGIRRILRHGTAGEHFVADGGPAAGVANLPSGLEEIRNRALLLFGYAGAMRRLELAAFEP